MHFALYRFVFNLGANTQYGDLTNITRLIGNITAAAMGNSSSVALVDEENYWTSCWMDIDLSWVTLGNMSQCDGYQSNIVWPADMTHFVDDDLYDIMSTVNCLVSEIIYDGEIVLDIGLTDGEGDGITVIERVNNTWDDEEDSGYDSCDGITFTICNANPVFTALFNDSESILSPYDIPLCQWSLSEYHGETPSSLESEWNTTGCFVSGYTSHCVECTCSHLTIFKADSTEFIPSINIVTTSSFQAISGDVITQNPGPLIFVICCFSIFVIFWMISRKCTAQNGQRDDDPVIAIPDTMNASIRSTLLNHSGYALSVMELERDDIGQCGKMCNIFVLYLNDYHSVLSIFKSSAHTNYSQSQRIFVCLMYICTVATVSAIFYGAKKETVTGSLVLMLWGSLLTLIPIYAVIYLFQFSRPKERASEIKDAIFKGNIMKAPCHRVTRQEMKSLSLELCAKWLISEMLIQQRNGKEMFTVSRPSIPTLYPEQSEDLSVSTPIPPELGGAERQSVTLPPPPPRAPKRRVNALPPPKGEQHHSDSDASSCEHGQIVKDSQNVGDDQDFRVKQVSQVIAGKNISLDQDYFVEQDGGHEDTGRSPSVDLHDVIQSNVLKTPRRDEPEPFEPVESPLDNVWHASRYVTAAQSMMSSRKRKPFKPRKSGKPENLGKDKKKSGKKMLQSMMVNRVANRVSMSRGDDFAEGHRRPTTPSMDAPRPMFSEHAMSGHHVRKNSYDALRLHINNESNSCSRDFDSELKVDEILDERDRDRNETVIQKDVVSSAPRSSPSDRISQSGISGVSRNSGISTTCLSNESGQSVLSRSLSRKQRILCNAYNVVQCEMIRKRVLKREYPLPYCTKKVAWTILIIWTVLCMILVVVYGAHFDLVYDSCVAIEGSDTSDCYKYTEWSSHSGRRLMDHNGTEFADSADSECTWKEPMEDRLYRLILQYISDLIDSDDFDLDGIPVHDDETLSDVGIEGEDILVGDAVNDRLDIFGANITDSDKWITSCLVSILLGFVIWQPLWLYLWAVLYVLLPRCGILRCTRRVCPCCFGCFAKMDGDEDQREEVLSEKLGIWNIPDIKSEGDEVSEQMTTRNMVRPHLRGHIAVPSNSILQGGDRTDNMQRISFSVSGRNSNKSSSAEEVELRRELSEVMEVEEEEEEDLDNSPSSNMFGIGDDEVIYFQHANNRHHRGGLRIYSFRDWIVKYDDSMSVDTEQFVSDLSAQ